MRPLLLLASAVCLSAAEPVTFLRDVAPILNKVELHVRPVSRRGQGKERLQALPARLRSAVRLRSAALRSCRAAASTAPIPAAA